MNKWRASLRSTTGNYTFLFKTSLSFPRHVNCVNFHRGGRPSRRCDRTSKEYTGRDRSTTTSNESHILLKGVSFVTFTKRKHPTKYRYTCKSGESGRRFFGVSSVA